MINFFKKIWSWVKRGWKKVWLWVGGIVIASTMGTVIIDSSINPYTEKSDRWEMSTNSVIDEAGQIKTELLKNEPKIILSKWNDEVRLGIKYLGIAPTTNGNKVLLTDRVEWKEAKQELHVYPLIKSEQREDGGFETEIVLNEKPATNVFKFQIDGAENLDFIYQPELTQQEIDKGRFRPENVVGSYAVYHKIKKDHILDQKNYATGKAFHIYRPWITDAKNDGVWGELSYINTILSVVIPQSFLDNALYPVKVDPTFGYTTIGASTGNIENTLNLERATITENGTGTKISVYLNNTTSSKNTKANVYDDGTGASDLTTNLITNGATEERSIGTGTAWQDFNFTVAPSFTANVVYRLAIWGAAGTGTNLYHWDNTTGNSYEDNETYGTWPNPNAQTQFANSDISMYATYTGTAKSRRIIID